MPGFRFRGFQANAPVAMTVAQGGNADSAELAEWGQEVSNLTISASVDGLAAPAPVDFNVELETWPVNGPTNVYNPRFHEITYVWDFGDLANDAPKYDLNVPDAWKHLNTGYGPRPAHTYSDHGTFTVTCRAYHAGVLVAVGNADVVIADPATVFFAHRTILYDPAGIGDEATYPGANIQTTYAGCITARQALGATAARILLKRGEVITDMSATGANNAFWLTGPSNFRMGAWGSGADPVLGPDVNVQNYFRLAGDLNGEFILHDLDIRGDWDSTGETGVLNRTIYYGLSSGQITPVHFCFHRCRFDGLDHVQFIFDNGIGETVPVRYIYSDLKITNWHDYGIYFHNLSDMPNASIAMVGLSIVQHVDALSGGTKGTFYNNHGGTRISQMARVHIDCADLFSRSGWSGLGRHDGIGQTADNACLRLQTSPAQGMESYVSRIATEGKLRIHRDASGGQNNRAVNTVLDKVLHIIGSRDYNPPISWDAGGTTLRNYLGVMLDVTGWAGAGISYFAQFNPGPDALCRSEPVAFYNNTFLDLRNDANAENKIFDDVDGQEVFSNFTLENCLNHAPNRSSPTIADAPVDVTTAIPGFACRHKGPRYNFKIVSGNLASDVANGASFTVPYAQITEDLYGWTGGAATNQAYWQAIEATDIRHKLQIDGSIYDAHVSGFTVDYQAGGVVITNTSGGTWPSGSAWNLRLDRKSLIPAAEATYSSEGQTVPLARPLAGSAAIDSGDTGLTAYDDFLGAVRPSTGNERGALLES